jgi:hypothetical protein
LTKRHVFELGPDAENEHPGWDFEICRLAFHVYAAPQTFASMATEEGSVTTHSSGPPHLAFMGLIQAIVTDDVATVSRLIAESPDLASARAEEGATRQAAKDHYLDQISHYLYAGDTALHIAAAGYRQEIARQLMAAGANVRARNRRGAEPLHYASDGAPGSRSWNPSAQAATIACLIEAGADPNAIDNSGVTPLHRAVRTRCAAAVSALLDNGADVRRRNKSGSTPMLLATHNTGRGGAGSPEAKSQQGEIVRLLEERGATVL